MGEDTLDISAAASTPESRKALIDTLDKYTESPEQRTQRIWNAINNKKHFTQWDIICFCALTLGAISETEDWLKPLIKKLSLTVFVLHYNRPFELHNFSPSDKEKLINELRILAESAGFSPTNTGEATPTES